MHRYHCLADDDEQELRFMRRPRAAQAAQWEEVRGAADGSVVHGRAVRCAKGWWHSPAIDLLEPAAAKSSQAT